MALQIGYSDKYGNTHATAYALVIDLLLNAFTSVAIAQVAVYKDKATRDASDTPSGYFNYTWEGADYNTIFGAAALDPVGTNPIKAVYDEIKGYAEWSGATDV